MLHKISQFCDKIDTIKNMSDELRVTKYGYPKSKERDFKIKNLIDTIQADCLLIAKDKSDYDKEKNVMRNASVPYDSIPSGNCLRVLRSIFSARPSCIRFAVLLVTRSSRSMP